MDAIAYTVHVHSNPFVLLKVPVYSWLNADPARGGLLAGLAIVRKAKKGVGQSVCLPVSNSMLFAVCYCHHFLCHHSSVFHHYCLTIIAVDPIMYISSRFLSISY